MSTVVFIGIATDAGIAVVVPRRLDRHGDTNPQNSNVHWRDLLIMCKDVLTLTPFIYTPP